MNRQCAIQTRAVLADVPSTRLTPLVYCNDLGTVVVAVVAVVVAAVNLPSAGSGAPEKSVDWETSTP